MGRNAVSTLAVVGLLGACTVADGDFNVTSGSGANETTGDAGSTGGSDEGEATGDAGSEDTETGDDGSCGSDEDCPDGEFCSYDAACIPDGTCDNSFDCPNGLVCDESECVPGEGGCGEAFDAEKVVPNLLLVVDRSCSMKEKIDGTPKWDITVDVISALTTKYEAEIRWGLTLFPDVESPSCQQADVPIPIADGNEAPIQTMLMDAQDIADPYYPNGPCITNIDTAVDQASKEQELYDPNHPGHVMLLTDGKQYGCSFAGGDTGTEQIITMLHDDGVTTFVVGFGSGVDANALDAFAVAGGAPLQGDPRYYQADDAMQLEDALDGIIGGIVGCSFKLDEEPPDAEQLYVFFDGEKVPRDPNHQEGWDYDANTNTITFYGSYCDGLQNLEVDDVDVVWGCDEPPD
jgi:hypothetical protein